MIIRVTAFVSLLLGYLLLNTSLVGGETNKTGIRAGKNFFLGSDEANFFQAYFNCKDGDMDLASLNSKQDEEDLAYFLQDVNKTGNQLGGFWLSATNLLDVNSTQYRWLTGGKRAIYTNWLPGEPTGGPENCLQWAVFSGIAGWNDYICQNKIRYICQDPE